MTLACGCWCTSSDGVGGVSGGDIGVIGVIAVSGVIGEPGVCGGDDDDDDWNGANFGGRVSVVSMLVVSRPTCCDSRYFSLFCSERAKNTLPRCTMLKTAMTATAVQIRQAL